MSAHTPGPWKAVKFNDQKSWTIQGGEFYHALANVKAGDDAALIAAAPDMLAALKRVAAEADGGRLSANDDELRDWLMAIRDVARAAVAKAEGTS